MTFYEAAVEVLRSAGRPLHVKKITAISVDQNLLTHVGRDPEKTMRARLSQEVAKTGESLIKSIRPNVYVLKDGADPDAARQTVQPRKVDVQDDEPQSTTHDDRHSAQDNQRDHQREERRGQHGRKNDRDSKDASRQDHNARSEKRDDKRDDKRENKRNDAPRQDNQQRAARQDHQRDVRRTPSAPSTAPSPAAQALAALRAQTPPSAPSAGDLAEHIHDILQKAPNHGLTLQEIGNKLADTAYAALPKLPLQALRTTLTRANQQRADKGQPPIFTTHTDGRWSLIKEDPALTDSLQILEQWQEHHKAILARRLEHVIDERSNEQLLGIIALVMERLGYENVELHRAEGDEIATFSATLNHGLSQSCVAVRVFAIDRPITRLDIMAFRGTLHQYQAERGTIFTLGGHSLCAREQIDAPNAAPVTLLQGSELADLMIRTHVGTTEVKVSVPHLDHAFFE